MAAESAPTIEKPALTEAVFPATATSILTHAWINLLRQGLTLLESVGLKCSKAASICVTKGQICQCEYDPYPSSSHENHRRSTENEALVDEVWQDDSAEDECRNMEERRLVMQTGTGTCTHKRNDSTIAIEQEHETGIVSYIQPAKMDSTNDESSESSKTKQERRASQPPIGICSKQGRNGALNCQHSRRICSHTPNSCIESKPCQCDYDPYVDGPEEREKIRDEWTRFRDVHKNWKEQVETSRSNPKHGGLRSVLGDEISDEDRSLPPGKCRKTNQSGLLQCFIGREKCSQEPCTEHGSVCKCKWDPRADMVKAQQEVPRTAHLQSLKLREAKDVHRTERLQALKTQTTSVKQSLHLAGKCKGSGGFGLRCYLGLRQCSDIQCHFEGAICQCTTDPYEIDRQIAQQVRNKAGHGRGREQLQAQEEKNARGQEKYSLNQREREFIATPITSDHLTGKCRHLGKGALGCYFLRRKCSSWGCTGLGTDCKCGFDPYELERKQHEQLKKSIDHSIPDGRVRPLASEKQPHRRVKIKADEKGLERRMQPQKEKDVKGRNKNQIEATAVEPQLMGNCRTSWSGQLACFLRLRICSNERCAYYGASCQCTHDPYLHENRLAQAANSKEHSVIEKQGQRRIGQGRTNIPSMTGKCLRTSSGDLRCQVSNRVCSDRICSRVNSVCQCNYIPLGLEQSTDLQKLEPKSPAKASLGGICVKRLGLLYCYRQKRRCSFNECPTHQAPCKCDYDPFKSEPKPEGHKKSSATTSALSRRVKHKPVGEKNLEQRTVQQDVEKKDNNAKEQYSSASLSEHVFVFILLQSRPQKRDNCTYKLVGQEQKHLYQRSESEEEGKKQPRLKYTEKKGAPRMKHGEKDEAQPKDPEVFKGLQITASQPGHTQSKGTFLARGLCKDASRGPLKALGCYLGSRLCSHLPCLVAESNCECTFDPASRAFPRLAWERSSEKEKQEPAHQLHKEVLDSSPRGKNGLPKGICRMDAEGALSCYSGLKKCADHPCAVRFSSCECAFDPALRATLTTTEKKKERKQQELDEWKSQKMFQQQRHTLIQPKGLRILTGNSSSSSEEHFVLPGYCRKSSAGELMCFSHLSVCSNDPCTVHGSICECTYDPKSKGRMNYLKEQHQMYELRRNGKNQQEIQRKTSNGLLEVSKERKLHQNKLLEKFGHAKVDQKEHQQTQQLDQQKMEKLAVSDHSALPQGKCRAEGR
ncbi:hypothetical protein MMC10_000592 [Thelotrema lepadinum]|nr:hypothetical protein [Thelotrema lepadinum]